MIAALHRADRALLRAARTRGHWRPLERALAAYSRTGEHSRLWIALSAAGFVRHPDRRQIYLRAGATVCAVEVVNACTKLAFRRPRPVLDQLPALCAVASARSFPSAHAATAFAAARVLSEASGPALPYAAAAVMAGSRPYLGVHYPSDVVAGALLGTAVAGLLARRPRTHLAPDRGERLGDADLGAEREPRSGIQDLHQDAGHQQLRA